MTCYHPDETLLFVHTPKAGGWTAKKYLTEYVPGILVHDTDVTREWVCKRADDLPKGHLRLAEFEDHTGRDPLDFDTILAVVRDPYEQQYSRWTDWRSRWMYGRRLPQHARAMTYPTFERWLEDPRSQFYAAYDYLSVPTKPLPDGEWEGYAEYGGYYPFWLAIDGQTPENLELIRLKNLDDRLPEIAAEFSDGPVGEVKHLNSGHDPNAVVREMAEAGKESGKFNETLDIKQTSHEGRKVTPDHPDFAKALTPKARRIIERRFRWSFETGLYPRWEDRDEAAA